MVFPFRPPMLELSQSLWFVSVHAAQVPWHVALACPVLDMMAPVAPFAPGLVVQLRSAEGHSGAIDSELALWAEKVNALWWGPDLFSCMLWPSAATTTSHLHSVTLKCRLAA